VPCSAHLASALMVTVAGGFVLATLLMRGQSVAENTQSAQYMQTKTIEAVLKAHTSRLMSLPDVVGTALGQCSGQPCIKVFVVKTTPGLAKQIPATIDGYPVTVQQTGEFQAR